VRNIFLTVCITKNLSIPSRRETATWVTPEQSSRSGWHGWLVTLHCSVQSYTISRRMLLVRSDGLAVTSNFTLSAVVETDRLGQFFSSSAGFCRNRRPWP
jgi:hypothetical protein